MTNLDAIINDTFKIAMQRYSAKLYQSAREGYEYVHSNGYFGQAATELVVEKQKRACFWSYPVWLERTREYPLGALVMMSIPRMPTQ